MRTTMKLLAPAILAALFAASPAMAQDKAKAATPDKAKATTDTKKADGKATAGKGTTKTLVDNEKVTVTEVTYKPGEASDMRERGARVSRALTAGTMERTYPDGKKQTVSWKAGEVKYFPKETFANKNVGKADMVLFVTTLK